MRKLVKLPPPLVLEENHNQWLEDYLNDKTSKTKKYRYRDQKIKAILRDETGWKCVYCESKIGHNTPGDVEHMIPTSKNSNLHFCWENLTVACTECNRRKNDYYDSGNEFLDPYKDNVEHQVEHYGPVMGHAKGDERAEITVKILELHSGVRISLILKKTEKIEELNNVIERFTKEKNEVLRDLMLRKIKSMIDLKSEYSGMLLGVLRIKGIKI